MARKKKIENDNNINSPVITDNIDYYFLEFCNSHNIKDPYKIPTTQYAASLMYINKHYIKPNKVLLLEKYSHGKYNLFAVDALADKYIYMCHVYNQPIMLMHFSYLSNIDYEYFSTWQHDNNIISLDMYKDNNIYKYNSVVSNGSNVDLYSNSGLTDGKRVTISRQKIYQKLVNSAIYISDSIALYKSGVNSIAYSNRVHERFDKTRNNNVPVFDAITTAESLGITDKIQALEDRKKQ